MVHVNLWTSFGDFVYDIEEDKIKDFGIALDFPWLLGEFKANTQQTQKVEHSCRQGTSFDCWVVEFQMNITVCEYIAPYLISNELYCMWIYCTLSDIKWTLLYVNILHLIWYRHRFISVQIPTPAQTNSTRFRLWQPQHDGMWKQFATRSSISINLKSIILLKWL